MNGLPIRRYYPKHPLLKMLIKYFWELKSDCNIALNHKLLPVNNIDVIFNFSSPIQYASSDNSNLLCHAHHFNGIRKQYSILQQVGKVNVLGISFFPAGLYPFLKIPLSDFTNQTINLEDVWKIISYRIPEKLHDENNLSDVERIEVLEEELLRLLDVDMILTDNIFRILNLFSQKQNIAIKDFCDEYGINKRRLERIFQKQVGISPKLFSRLIRYQKALNTIIAHPNINLTALTYENGYYDQAHFIREFKSFTGSSPSQFLSEKKSIKENLIFY